MLLQDTIRRHAIERPEATAIVSGPRSVSYRQLDDRSTQLARLLILAGCRPGDRIVLLSPKSIEAITAMLGVLKAGAIYVPIDTRSPLARVAKMLDRCAPACLLAAGEGAALVDLLLAAGRDIPRIGWLDHDSPDSRDGAFHWADVDHVSAAPLRPEASEHDPAHILFTSGSTGTPKGVVITHANVNRFITWATGYFDMRPGDHNSGHPPLHFDLSTFDIYGTFLAGGELHLVPPETSFLPHKIAEFIRTAGLIQWFSVPSALRFMEQFNAVEPGDFPHLRRILWCGEALPAATLIYWMQRLPHVRFTNLYGPTEATIASSYYTVPECPSHETAPIPIGSACDGERLNVLDESLQPCGPGETGDLYISGAGLSPGYWKDPEKTAAAFFTAPNGERIYKTGDLARFGGDGLLYLLGRSDSQVKSRGYRIELGEIEASLRTLEEIRDCAVVALPSGDFGGTAICCAYVSQPGLAVPPTTLKEKLSALLPLYMLPSQWMSFESLPLNGNGKIDRPRVREHFEAKAVPA